MAGPSAKRIKTQQELASIVEKAKSEGKTVVFTNGVFDFVHVGHLTYLEKARELGDMLVIGLNNDASIRRIKGPTRPINSEDDRGYILTGLRCVDYVSIFEEDTANNILDLVKPDIYVKGGDYTPKKLPEAPTVIKNGGKVVIIPLEDGYSNSSQFKKIQTAENTKTDFQRPDFLAK